MEGFKQIDQFARIIGASKIKYPEVLSTKRLLANFPYLNWRLLIWIRRPVIRASWDPMIRTLVGLAAYSAEEALKLFYENYFSIANEISI